MPEPVNQAAIIAMTVAFLLSLVTLFIAFQRHVAGKPLLAYEPRRRVPWGPLATVVPILILLLSFISAFTTSDVNIDPAEFVSSGWKNSAGMLGFVVMAMAWLSALVDADARDLGLPTAPREFASDVGVGIFACLASLLPIYLVQFLLYVTLEPEQQHELIELLLEHGSSQLILVGVVLAVIASPLFEEFTFRVLLQGWLERCEDELIDYRDTLRELPEENSTEESERGEVDRRGPVYSHANLPVNGAAPSTSDANDQGAALTQRQRGMLFGMPRGWTPVLISGVAFGLAHIGQGVAPVPLILFGLVLGYLYQRTHRLMPCVAAHMLFNAYTMGLLWLQIS